MKITQSNIIAAIERLAEACPWQHVDIWITRKPEGTYAFTAYAHEEPKFGIRSAWGHGGNTPDEAVDNLLKNHLIRTPEEARRVAVAELRDKIEKLQAAIIGLPPYKPGRELTNGEPTIQAQETINV